MVSCSALAVAARLCNWTAGKPEIGFDVHTLKVLIQQTRSKVAHPFIEVAELNPRAVKVAILQDPMTEQLASLVSHFEKTCSKER